jgi:glycerol-3-phosphate acyltransferase PlsY
VLTLLLDGVKGWLPVALVVFFGKAYGMGGGTVALVGLAAFLGHLYPVFFGFKGGKGVATAAGVLLGINGWLGLAVLLTWLTVAVVFRYSSLAALLAALSAPLYYFFADRWLGSADRLIGLTVLVMSALLIWRHRENIARLVRGQESKLGAKK